LVGRILMGGFFLWNGIEATLNFPNTVVTFSTLSLPSPLWFAVFAIAIEVLCGVGLIVGFWSRVAALVLVVFVIAAALVQTGLSTGVTETLFLQDMAIIGGLLYISAYGAGAWSPQWRYRR